MLPSPIVKSSVVMPDLKSTPVTVKVGLLAPFAMVDEVLRVLLDANAGTVNVKVLLAAAGATVNAEVFA